MVEDEKTRVSVHTPEEKVWMGSKVVFTLFTAFYSIFIGFVMKCIFYYALHTCNMKIIKHLEWVFGGRRQWFNGSTTGNGIGSNWKWISV